MLIVKLMNRLMDLDKEIDLANAAYMVLRGRADAYHASALDIPDKTAQLVKFSVWHEMVLSLFNMKSEITKLENRRHRIFTKVLKCGRPAFSAN